MRRILPIVYHHHERLDGSGYPDGMWGDAITLPIRIVTVSDIFDVLTSTRAYRDAHTTAAAFEVLNEGVLKGDGGTAKSSMNCAAAWARPAPGLPCRCPNSPRWSEFPVPSGLALPPFRPGSF